MMRCQQESETDMLEKPDQQGADRPSRCVILIVCDYALSYMGGAQTALRQQARAFHENGHVVWVAAPRASADRELSAYGVHPLDPPATLWIPGTNFPLVRNTPLLRRRLREAMVTSEIDLVITHSEFGLAAGALMAARSLGLPTLHTVHTFFWRSPRNTAFLAPWARAAYRLATGLTVGRKQLVPQPLGNTLRNMTLAACEAADVVVSPSEHQAIMLREAGLPDVRTVSNASCRGAITPTPPPENGPLRLVWAARFAPEKRLDVMLDAARLVEKQLGPQAVHIDIAGGTLPTESVPESVTVHGRVSAQEIDNLLRDAHAAVITSHGFDNQPMIALEAFRNNRPVIVSDRALDTEFGIAAILTDDTTALGLAATIVRLATDRTLLRSPTAAAASQAQLATAEEHTRRILASAAHHDGKQRRHDSVQLGGDG
ncbi:glycosyltransferase [Rathayibacter toxicus]|nr:glycosyltransferase family 4 protein [Rathayibacter toxicus]PPI56250.1 glycosyltransferase [Rathayibacter toxicus]QOD09952.1 glycosyltransferase family 4 protein [Rathayibacter toxicus]QWL28628.1 glycosyltransferase [Rathayibacter toxicus]